MKVLVVSHNYPTPQLPSYGGFVHQQLRELVKRGHEITVLAALKWRAWPWPFTQRMKHQQRDGISIVYSWFPSFSNGSLLWLSAYTQLLATDLMWRSLHGEQPPDVIFINNVFPDGLSGIYLMRQLSIPSVTIARGSDVNVSPKRSRIVHNLCRRTLSTTNYVLATSRALLREAIALCGKPLLHCDVLHNGVELSHFYPHPDRSMLRRKRSIPDGHIVLGYVGGLLASKGIYEIASVFGKLAQRYDVELQLVGDGPERLAIERHLLSIVSPNHFRLTGQLAGAEVNEALNCCDIFVFPSHREGLSNAVLEAMAVGLPIVATRVGGIPELVAHGENGYLVGGHFKQGETSILEYADEKDLETYLELLISNRDLRVRMGQRSLEIVREWPSWQDNASRLECILREVIQCRISPVRRG